MKTLRFNTTICVLLGVGAAASVLLFIGKEASSTIDISKSVLNKKIEKKETVVSSFPSLSAAREDNAVKKQNIIESSEGATDLAASTEGIESELGLPLPDNADELLETVFTLTLDSTTHEALASLYRITLVDPIVAEDVSKKFLKRIEETEDTDDIEVLYGFLSYISSAEVTRHAFELLSSEDSADRTTAYHLLSNSKDADPSLVLKKVWSEPSGVLASQAISAIGERDDIVQRTYEPEMKTRLTSELNIIYASHDEPEVRAAALTQISLLDDQGDDSRALIESALDNGNPSIRSAAIAAVAENEYYSETNKSKLLSIAADSDVNINTRYIAHEALAFYDFELQESEKHRLIELKKELDQLDSII